MKWCILCKSNLGLLKITACPKNMSRRRNLNFLPRLQTNFCSFTRNINIYSLIFWQSILYPIQKLSSFLLKMCFCELNSKVKSQKVALSVRSLFLLLILTSFLVYTFSRVCASLIFAINFSTILNVAGQCCIFCLCTCI
jgi:hypothetical protein